MIMGIAMVVGIAPALALMFIGVRNYTYPRVEQPFFSDPTFFMLFVVGLVEGSIIFVVMRLFNAPTSIILMVLMAVIQIMAMVLVMNLRRFRGKSDSVFYGFALGLGNSCGFATGFCFLIYSVLDTMEASAGPSFVVLVLISVSMSLIMGACGTNVGEGIARHRVMEYSLQALLPMVAYDMLLCGAVLNGDSMLFYVFLGLMLVLGAVYYYYIMQRKLPNIVREVLLMEGKKRADIPKRSRAVEPRPGLDDEPAVQHGGQHLLRPPRLVLPQVLQGELALQRGQPLGEDRHPLVQVPGVLVAVRQGGPGVRLLDPPPLGGDLLPRRDQVVGAHGTGQCRPHLGLVLRLEDEPGPAGPLGVPAPGAGRHTVVGPDDPGSAAEAALHQAVGHLYSANTRAETQQP